TSEAASHRRRDVAPVSDRRHFDRAIGFLDRVVEEEPDARLELIFGAIDIADDDRLRRHDHLLLAVLVLERDHLTVNAGDRGVDRGIRHRTAGLQIPRPEPLAGAALRVAEDMNRDRLLAAVGLRHGADADIDARLDVLERGLHRRGKPNVVRHYRGEGGALARLDRERLAFDLLERSADTDPLRLLGDARARDQGRSQTGGAEHAARYLVHCESSRSSTPAQPAAALVIPI